MSDSMHIEITDNSEKVKEEFEAAVLRALEKCGLVAEGHAKKLCPVDTGLLRNSITHAISGEVPAIQSYSADKANASGVKKTGMYQGTAPMEAEGKAVYIGTNVEYSADQELGSGKHYAGGRQTKWTYEDAKGKMHITGGNTAKPFLKPAVADHAEEYRKIIELELKG